MPITCNPERDVTPAFMQQVTDWIRHSGEVLVVLRYLMAAGSRDFALCRSQIDFEALVDRAPRGCDIEVFRDPQLPLRGIVDAAFLEAALIAIPEGAEYLWVTLETRPGTTISRSDAMGDTHAELREDLQAKWEIEIALGLCPDFCADDHAGLISASKGGIDGPR